MKITQKTQKNIPSVPRVVVKMGKDFYVVSEILGQ
jgi:hypothetical protein